MGVEVIIRPLFCFVLFRRYEASDRQEGTMSLGSVYAGRQ